MVFWRKRKFGDKEKARFTSQLGRMFEVQAVLYMRHLAIGECAITLRALGYVYGFVDCSLQSHAQDMNNMDLSVPIVFHAMRAAFPGFEEKCMTDLLDHLQDQEVLAGILVGGQQFAEYIKPGSKSTPLGLARIILDTAKNQVAK